MGGKTRYPRRGNGAGVNFLRSMLDNAPPDCVTWPLFRDPNGYGRVGYNGRAQWAHTLMCTLANGERPSPDHEATHSCGNGKAGCVNPRHLSWGTRSRNQLDRAYHGTKARGGHRRPSTRKLSPADVEEIRRLKGQMTQRAIAERFGVTDATIRDIYSGKSWSRQVTWQELTADQVAEIRKLVEYVSINKAAKILGLNRSRIDRLINGKTYKDLAA